MNRFKTVPISKCFLTSIHFNKTFYVSWFLLYDPLFLNLLFPGCLLDIITYKHTTLYLSYIWCVCQCTYSIYRYQGLDQSQILAENFISHVHIILHQPVTSCIYIYSVHNLKSSNKVKVYYHGPFILVEYDEFIEDLLF
jgi:hypothetical protein